MKTMDERKILANSLNIGEVIIHKENSVELTSLFLVKPEYVLQLN
jgi:hypothetical protein